MVREIALDDHFSRLSASAGTAGDLRQELECTFGRPEVGQRKGGIRGDNAHQGDVREVMTFGDHLRTDEDIDISYAEVAENPLVIPKMPHGIPINAADCGVGK